MVLEGGAGHPRLADLHHHLTTDLPPLADHRAHQVDPACSQVLSEPSRRDALVQLLRPPLGVLVGIGVDRLVHSPMIDGVQDLVAHDAGCGQRHAIHRRLVDASRCVRTSGSGMDRPGHTDRRDHSHSVFSSRHRITSVQNSGHDVHE